MNHPFLQEAQSQRPRAYQRCPELCLGQWQHRRIEEGGPARTLTRSNYSLVFQPSGREPHSIDREFFETAATTAANSSSFRSISLARTDSCTSFRREAILDLVKVARNEDPSSRASLKMAFRYLARVFHTHYNRLRQAATSCTLPTLRSQFVGCIVHDRDG